jgi:hypothetical protein
MARGCGGTDCAAAKFLQAALHLVRHPALDNSAAALEVHAVIANTDVLQIDGATRIGVPALNRSGLTRA